ncbi:6-phosphogluconate dehydrogenase [Aspergillus alliaceus]|uniref:6-phosphogluconate dehydrogenase n=1 Tax=Petromyces alliaceus TaxID=209559 RepID=A0A5N7CIH4_PETAA|nr:6-phosphogluconate dehydrogenase [Aspergillus alliaceus]
MSVGETLKSRGAIPATEFIDLVKRCDILFTMVPNDEVLQRLIKLAIAGSQGLSSKIFVDCSTVYPDTTEKLSSHLAKQEAVLLSAPVFGGPAVASTGNLNASSASLLKIGSNIITLSLMEAVGEAQVFAEKTRLSTAAMGELITESFGAIAGGYSKRLTSGIYAPPLDTRPEFGVTLAIKDSKHALSMAEEYKFKLPGLELASKHMNAARVYGGECQDASAIYGILRQHAGLSFWNENSHQDGK